MILADSATHVDCLVVEISIKSWLDKKKNLKSEVTIKIYPQEKTPKLVGFTQNWKSVSRTLFKKKLAII